MRGKRQGKTRQDQGGRRKNSDTAKAAQQAAIHTSCFWPTNVGGTERERGHILFASVMSAA